MYYLIGTYTVQYKKFFTRGRKKRWGVFLYRGGRGLELIK
jgi:hypothetical protein